jgi:hypothetical protein
MPLTACSAPGISSRGHHRPARNISGKKTNRPTAVALVAVLAAPAITSPMENSPAMDSRTESAKPAAFFGAGAPRAVPATTMMRIMAAAMHRLTTPCAASSQDGGTGVVDRRRRIPSSR